MHANTDKQRRRKFSCRPATPRDSCTSQPLHVPGTSTACYNGLRGWCGENKPPCEHPAIKEESVHRKRCTCISRYDNAAYTRIQFLNAGSHSVGAHSNALCEVDNQSDTDERWDRRWYCSSWTSITAHAAAQSDDHAELCEVCLIQPRESRLTLVPCGHCRFCESCSNEVPRIAHGCPLCRTPIDMILCLY